MEDVCQFVAEQECAASQQALAAPPAAAQPPAVATPAPNDPTGQPPPPAGGRCLPGCIAPEKGMHHRKCPNFSQAEARSVTAKLDAEEIERMRAIGGPSAATYGEITPDGFREIFGGRLQPSDRFVDLGSGNGKLVVQAAEEFDVAAATGIELSHTRHEIATAARAELAARNAALAPRCTFLCEDCAGEAAASVLEGTTVVWVANLCFSNALKRRLASRLEQARSIRLVAATTAFDPPLRGFEVEGYALVQATWTTSTRQRAEARFGSQATHPGQKIVRYVRTAT